MKLAVDSLLVVAGRRDGNGGTALDIHQGSISMGEGGEGRGNPIKKYQIRSIFKQIQ